MIMIIGVDASKAAARKKTGVENAVYQLILALKKIDQKNLYSLYTDRHLPPEITSQYNMIEKYIPAWRFWNKIRLPLALIFDRPNCFFEPGYMLPPFAPKKSVMVVHDLAWVKFPKSYSCFERLLQRETLANANRHAKKIICVSDSTKIDLLSKCPSLANRIEIVHLAYDDQLYQRVANPNNVLKIDEPYILYVGRLEERKNIARLIDAFFILKNDYKIPHKLVLVGKKGYNFQKINEAIERTGKHKSSIILPGYIKDREMPDLYAGAELFAFPTLYEGFGIPVLEAMACGTAVVTSNISSLPEVAGDAAILVDPLSTEEIATGMLKILFDKKKKEELISLGLEQVKKFSWEKAALKIKNILENL